MGLTSTIYDVRANYTVTGAPGAQRAMSGIGMKADEAAKKVDGLGKTLKGLAAGLGVGMLFRGAKAAFVDFNAEIDTMRIGLSTIISTQMGMKFETASRAAESLFARFQEAAKSSPATTKDFIEMANGIANAVGQAGGDMNTLFELSKGSVIAAQAFGISSEVAQLDISQMLEGRVGIRDRLARAMLVSVGHKDYAQFNKMKQGDRLAIAEKALKQEALQKAAQQYGSSFTGVTSTLKDTLQMGLGKVGIPLFKAITAEIQRWNTWIDKNPEKIAAFASKLSGALVTGFEFLKGVGEFFVKHADTLMALAKVWIGLKLGGAITSTLGSAGGGMLGPGRHLAATFKRLDKPAGGLAASFMTMGKNIPSVIDGFARVAGVLGLVYTAAKAFADWIDNRQTADLAKRDDVAGQVHFAKRFLKAQGGVDAANSAYSLADGAPKGTQRESLLSAQATRDKEIFGVLMKGVDSGLISLTKDENGFPAHSSRIAGSAGAQAATDNLVKAGMKLEEAANVILATQTAYQLAGSWSYEDWKRLNPTAFATVADGPKKDEEKKEYNINIDRIEVLSDDPDRFVHGMIRTFDDVARSPTQAGSALRGGF